MLVVVVCPEHFSVTRYVKVASFIIAWPVGWPCSVLLVLSSHCVLMFLEVGTQRVGVYTHGDPTAQAAHRHMCHLTILS